MSAVPAPSETGFPMPRKITVLANKPAADAGSGATDFAFLELSETLKRLPDTQITLFGNETFCAPHSFQTNLLAACRQLMASGEANAEKIIASAKNFSVRVPEGVWRYSFHRCKIKLHKCLRIYLVFS